jgi:DNA-binding FrmR family transcriptional regulator
MENSIARQEMKKRLRRLEGQIRGIESMLDEERDCKEIVQQMLSVRAAVQSANMFFIREYMDSCMTAKEQTDMESARQKMDEIVTMLSKAS